MCILILENYQSKILKQTFIIDFFWKKFKIFQYFRSFGFKNAQKCSTMGQKWRFSFKNTAWQFWAVGLSIFCAYNPFFVISEHFETCFPIFEALKPSKADPPQNQPKSARLTEESYKMVKTLVNSTTRENNQYPRGIAQFVAALGLSQPVNYKLQYLFGAFCEEMRAIRSKFLKSSQYLNKLTLWLEMFTGSSVMTVVRFTRQSKCFVVTCQAVKLFSKQVGTPKFMDEIS